MKIHHSNEKKNQAFINFFWFENFRLQFNLILFVSYLGSRLSESVANSSAEGARSTENRCDES